MSDNQPNQTTERFFEQVGVLMETREDQFSQADGDPEEQKMIVEAFLRDFYDLDARLGGDVTGDAFEEKIDSQFQVWEQRARDMNIDFKGILNLEEPDDDGDAPDYSL